MFFLFISVILPQMEIRAVIFDLDGTLLDTLEDIADSMNRVLTRVGIDPQPTECYKDHVGRGVHNMVKSVLTKAGKPALDTDLSGLIEAFSKEYALGWRIKTRPYKGIIKLLEILKKDYGLKTGILSNKPHDFVEIMVKEFFPSCTFEAVFGAREGYPIKPDPAVPVKIAELLSAEPSKVLFVGDSPVDIATALNSGMIPLGVSWGFRPKEELLSSGSLGIAEDPMEILSYLAA